MTLILKIFTIGRLHARDQSQSKVRDAKVCLLLLIVGLILWAKHAALFVASFCDSMILD